jgi:imidazolonepropionase-like amidohydrolase
MKRNNLKMKISTTLSLLLFTIHFSLSTVSAQIAVKGETVHTMAGEPLTNGVILIGANGRIEAVGAASQVTIPANYRVISAKVVTPGLIDAHTVIGLNGYLNQPHEQMALDASAPMQPELRAIDAYNPEEKLIEWVRGLGVTTLHTGHQPSALVSGQTMIVKTTGKTVEEAALVPTAMIAVTIGDAALAGQGRSPGTRAKQAAMLRAELIKAQEAVRRADAARTSQAAQTQATTATRPTDARNNDNSPNVSNPNSSATNPPPGNAAGNNSGNPTTPTTTAGQTTQTTQTAQTSTASSVVTDLRGDMMQRVARREIPLLITAQRAQDIMTALRIAKEFNIRIVLDGVAEAHFVIDEIKASGFPVVVHPTMARAGGETENMSMETASKLKRAGIPFALQSGYEGYVPKTRIVLFEAAIAAANGLSQRDALASVTIDAAKILGMDGRIGSLAVGKDADLAMFDGDPFEYTTHCVGTIINGKVVSEIVR